ncbi:MAG: TRAP transporter small permease subunit [Ramlibacter sp.]|uniref:TRAP transporter small permease subunit n=1 Tax=Ramlibacter sp. TaxID=1917967 RepID=UPI00262EFD5A|nr:TRAP transporter small permease subunit [Ramlibacter sp.]MDH4377619.1 TRAP transporter small permease subunit [Ramlibacter sp.]
MPALLAFARGVDWLTDRFGNLAQWAAILACAISAGNAVIRYGFDISSNAWLEIQWYLFAACVMLGASQVLRLNEHVRVDILYGKLSARGKVWVDLLGLIFFLLPAMGVLLWYAAPLFLSMYQSGEMSSNAGGLIRWPAMLMLPLGFGLVLLQGLAEIIKRIGWLQGVHEMAFQYERPLQ